MAVPKRGGIEKLGEVLSRLMQKRGYAAPLAQEALQQAWLRAAGERLAGRSRVATLRGGVLTIEVQSAAQRYELEAFKAPEFLAALQQDESIPMIQRIVFRVGR